MSQYQPKHATHWPTTGAFILFLVLGLAMGALAIIQGFQNARTHRKILADEQCQAQVIQQNFNRNAILAKLNDEDDAARDRLAARQARDVFLQQHGQSAALLDIPKAYEAYRASIIAINSEKAKQGALISASTPPPGCKLHLARTSASVPPSVTTTGLVTKKPRPSLTSTVLLLPLPEVITVTVTATRFETIFLHGRTSFITVHSHPRTKTRTVMVTITARPSPQRTRTH